VIDDYLIDLIIWFFLPFIKLNSKGNQVYVKSERNTYNQLIISSITFSYVW
jgi:hypothetical protein